MASIIDPRYETQHAHTSTDLIHARDERCDKREKREESETEGTQRPIRGRRHIFYLRRAVLHYLSLLGACVEHIASLQHAGLQKRVLLSLPFCSHPRALVRVLRGGRSVCVAAPGARRAVEARVATAIDQEALARVRRGPVECRIQRAGRRPQCSGPREQRRRLPHQPQHQPECTSPDHLPLL